MKHILLISGWVMVIVGAMLIVYTVYVFLTEKMKLNRAPREAMFQCSVHGWILKKHLIEFLGQSYCAQCYYDRQREASKIV